MDVLIEVHVADVVHCFRIKMKGLTHFSANIHDSNERASSSRPLWDVK